MELGETPPELVDLQERILMGGLEAVAGTSAADGGEVEKRAGKRGREVMAKPSGNNSFTFFMPEEEEDEFDGGGDEEEEDMELDAVQSVGRAPGDKAREYDDAEPGEDLPRERQLTQKFLAGQLSFKDLMQEMNEKDDREDEDEYRQDSDDEDWKPSPVKSRPRATRGSSQANSPEARPSVSERKRSMESFETELEDSQKAQLRRKKKGSSSVRRRRLDPALQGLMGEANLRFAKGDTDTAERMCMEVIRQDPTAPEPFQTLATLYEEQGELERSLQFGLLAAHLAPQDGAFGKRVSRRGREKRDSEEVRPQVHGILWSPTSEELLSHLGHCWAKLAGAAPKGVIAPILRNEQDQVPADQGAEGDQGEADHVGGAAEPGQRKFKTKLREEETRRQRGGEGRILPSSLS